MDSNEHVAMPFSSSFFALSKMLVAYDAEISEKETSMTEDPQPNGLIIPDLDKTPTPVQRDGPGSRGARGAHPTMSLRTLDGDLYVYNHGQMVQKGLFEYRHIASPEAMNTLLKIGEGIPSLAPDKEDIDGTKLTKVEKKSTPTSETASLKSVKYGLNLVLKYNDDPSEHELITLSDEELKKIMEGKENLHGYKINPLVKIRTTYSNSTNGNNIALYFITEKYYYFLRVDARKNPPELEAVPFARDPEFNPKVEFLRHLQFKEIPCHHGHDMCDGGQLETVIEDDTKITGYETKTDPGELLPDFTRSKSEGSTPEVNKPSTLRFLSDPNTSKKADHMPCSDPLINDCDIEPKTNCDHEEANVTTNGDTEPAPKGEISNGAAVTGALC